MNCPYCANAVPDGAAFCGNCGAKLEAAAPPAGLPPQSTGEISQEPPPPPAPFSAPVMEPVGPPPGFTASYAPPPAPAKKSNTTLILVVIGVALLLCCCCSVFFAVAQMGPVFTDIIGQMVTPTTRIR
jgi:hypothetical protein